MLVFLYLNSIGGISDEQAVFWEGHSIKFSRGIQILLYLYFQKSKRVYSAFVDYKKAFDLVSRSHLWHKLISHGINCAIVRVIYSLYLAAKSCVKSNGRASELFPCNIGVRQDENLSPILFAIYLNDFEYFISRDYSGLSSLSTDFHNYLNIDDVEVYIKLYVLLYADDTILMTELPMVRIE